MIVVVGSLSFDFIMNFPGRFADQIMPEKIHILNLSFLAVKLNKNFGGTSANIAYNLALLGQKPVILSTAGFLRNFNLKVCGQMGSVATAYTPSRKPPTFSRGDEAKPKHFTFSLWPCVAIGYAGGTKYENFLQLETADF